MDEDGKNKSNSHGIHLQRDTHETMMYFLWAQIEEKREWGAN